jgi:hypothetical protein
VQKERTQEESPAAAYRAGDFPGRIPKLPGGRFSQAAMAMRPGHNPQWAILGTAIVDVEANGQHPFEQLRRSLDEIPALLPRPDAERRMLDPLPDRNAQVLMKRDQPVPLLGFLEERALDGYRRRRQGLENLRVGPDAFNQATTPWQVEEIACAGAGELHAFERLSRRGGLFRR